jgi:hypothetical protein
MRARRGGNGHLTAQNANGVSHLDNTRAVRKFMIFARCELENANSEYAYGITGFNVSGTGTPLSDLLDDYGRVFEQYRVRRVRIRALPGRGFTNALRLKTFVASRVDVDHQDTSSTISNLKSLINAENSVIKTMIEKGNILLADFQPQCRVNTTASLPILPNRLQFYPVADYETHIWKGAIIGAFHPEVNSQTGTSITLSAEVEVEFRGRVTAPHLYTTEHLNQTAPPPTPDLTGTLDELRNRLLTGQYVPIGTTWPSIGNIGHTVTSSEMLDQRFRESSTQKVFYVSEYSQESDTWSAMIEESL